MNIRTASDKDSQAIQALYRSAFPENEAERIALLADDLLKEVTLPDTFTLVAEDNNCIVGAISFSPVTINTDSSWQGYILAPLGVIPESQNSGVGSALVEAGISMLADSGINRLFVYGDPAYYSRFGFDTESALCFTPPYRLEFPGGFQARIFGKDNTQGQQIQLSCVASLADPGLW